MKVSVIIPTNNRPEMTAQAVESVLAQSYSAAEIIVVDDGSTDDTQIKMRGFGERIHYVFQPNAGISAARNKGIEIAQNEWLAFLDSDDLWKPDKLHKQVNALKQHPEYKICYTGEEWQRYGKIVNQKVHQQKYGGQIYVHCLPLCIISASSIMLHRSVMEQVGVFDTNLPACEDYDLWLRLTSRFPVLLLEEKLIVKRAGDWPQLSMQFGLDKYRIIALQKMLNSDVLDAEQKKQTLHHLHNKVEIYTNGCRKHGKTSEVHWAMNILKECGDQE